MSIVSDTQSLIAQLYEVESKAEIVAGEIVVMSPLGPRHGRVAHRICSSLESMEAELEGFAVGDGVGFLVDLPGRKSFSPDAAFCRGALPATDEEDDFIRGAPAFAVEVRSRHDYGPAAEEKLAKKRAEYFAAGTEVVWDVALRSDEVVRVYRQGDTEPSATYARGGVAEAEPAVPGWTLAVDELFE